MPGLLVILYEENTTFRQIFIDGRPHPMDPQPTWLGYSTGKWEANTLVVDTTGFNDRSWLDTFGAPHSDKLHLIEKFRRRDMGHMEIDISIDDLKTYVSQSCLHRTCGFCLTRSYWRTSARMNGT